MLKLGHLVDDKMHAINWTLFVNYSAAIGGKAQFGGQRFGGWRWALEAFDASHVLQEILTVNQMM